MFNFLEAMQKLTLMNKQFTAALQLLQLMQVMVKDIHASNATPEQIAAIEPLHVALSEVNFDEIMKA